MTQPPAASGEARGTRPTAARIRRWAVLVLMVAIGAAGVGWKLWPVTPDKAVESQEPASTIEGDPTADGANPAGIRDAELRAQILGHWELYEDGDRYLIVRRDGTASLDYRPNAAYSWILGERVEIELKWKLVDGKGYFRSLRGKPKAAFQWISTFKGIENVWEIKEVDARHALMWDEKDQSHFDWQRAAAPLEAEWHPHAQTTSADAASAAP